MPDYRYVGQDQGSLDCGFFAGYTLRLMQDTGGDVANLEMTQAEVYAARDRFFGSDASSPGQAGNQWLDYTDAPRYLDGIGVGGYWVEDMFSVRSTAGMLNRILNHLGRANSQGIMVAQIGQLQHWVSILAIIPPNESEGIPQKLAIYDPGFRETSCVQAIDQDRIASALVNNLVGALIVSAS